MGRIVLKIDIMGIDLWPTIGEHITTIYYKSTL